jgi:nitrate reductase assembly molybdenum cofactor insertion protein NarJ
VLGRSSRIARVVAHTILSRGLTLDSPEADPYFPDSLDLLAQARSQKLKVKHEIDSQVQEHSLALLCGFLNPCNKYYFLFLFALFEYLDDPDEERILPAPFCGNISHSRHLRYYRVINALRRYLGKPPEGSLPEDKAVLVRIGEPTAVRRWLVASLEKTLREQTPPPYATVNE